MGHKVFKKPLGCRIQAIKKEGKLLGVSDPRGEGAYRLVFSELILIRII